jgi:lipid-A-disaccharide synthase
MPGSRAQEVRRHLEIFSSAADLVARRRTGVQVMIGAASNLPGDAYAGSPHPRTIDTAPLLRHATAALVKSGTTTLETALAETPFVVAYRMNRLSFQLAKRLVKVPHIALANLVANARVAPEYVQDAATPEALADALSPLLDAADSQRIEMVARLRGVRSALGRGGAGKRVAEIAAELLEPGATPNG